MNKHAQLETVRRIVTTQLPTRLGMFQVIGFVGEVSNSSRSVESALAIVMNDLADLADLTTEAPLLRLHSQCLTSEAFGSLRCDCADQLEIAMQAISEEGRGLVIYEYQEGRGIGLMAKLKAYALQDEGLDTVEANRALGFMADLRDYSLPAAVLNDLGITRVRLLTNNPSKKRALISAGIEVVAQIPCEAAPNPHSIAYLQAKKERMGHALNLERYVGAEITSSDLPNDCFRCVQDSNFAAQ
jgi:GTP cyclohydrolase II